MIVEAALVAPVAYFSGIYSARYVQRYLPMRQPSNKVRIANAKTDLELKKMKADEIEAEKEILKEQGELRYTEIEVERQLIAKENELKMLTTGADDSDIGALIVARRKARKITQSDLADMTNIPVNRLSSIENAFARDITLDELSRIAAALQLEYHPPRFALTARS